MVAHAPEPPPPPLKSVSHVGTPPDNFNTWPLFPAASFVSELLPSAYKISPVAYVVCAVPPRVAVSVPVVSESAILNVEVAMFTHALLPSYWSWSPKVGVEIVRLIDR